MKIAIVSPVFPPYAGGIGNTAFHNADILQRMGYEVTVFTPDYGQGEIETAFKIVKLRPLIKYGNSALIPKLYKLLRNFDVVHLHYPFFGGAEMIWLGRKKIKKIVLHYHMDVVGKGFLGFIFKTHGRLILPKIINSANKIIVTSFDYAKNSNIKEFMRKNPEKFIEVPNGVDIERFNPTEPSKELKSLYNLENKKIILFVGALDRAHYFKGVNNLISAFKKKFADTKLIIVGAGDLAVNYKKQAKDLDLEGEVIFTGRIGEKDLPKYYNLADVTVLPSIDKSEAFGMVLIESLACGKPVIASNLAGVRSVVGECGFLVEPGDINGLAKKINKILSDVNLAKTMGQQGRQKVESLYSWDKIGKTLSNLYEELSIKA